MLKVVYNRKRAKPVRTKNPGVITYVRFSPDDHVRLRERAQTDGVTMSRVIRDAVSEWLGPKAAAQA